jgi:hypothetical protein
LEDLGVKALLAEGRPLRSAELSETALEGARLAGDLWRQYLEESERVFLTEDRHWDLAVRRPAGGRTVDGTIGDLLRAANVPVHVEQIIQVVSAAKGQSTERIGPAVRNLLGSREKYVEVLPNHYAPEDWFIDTTGQDEELVVMENFLDHEPGFQKLRDAVSRQTLGRLPVEVCKTVIGAAGTPVPFRVLSFFCWKANPKGFDPVAVLRELVKSDALAPLYPARWCDSSLVQELRTELLKQSRELAKSARPAAGKVADLDSLLAARVPESAVVTLREQDMLPVLQLAEEAGAAVSLVATLAEVFEMYPADDAFVPAAQAFATRLNRDERFQLTGPGLWVPKQHVPPEATEVPAGLEPVTLDTRTIDNELIDALLEDPGLEGALKTEVRDPYWEDFGEEDEVLRVPQSKQSVDELRYTVLYHHYLAGTMKVRKMDERFFPETPKLQRIVLIDEQSRDHVAWVNLTAGLVTGLRGIYAARLQPSGGTLKLTKTDEANVFELQTEKQPDRLTEIEASRLDELHQIAEQERSRPDLRTLLDITTDLFILTPRGFDFHTLWAELNVIRRTSKRLVASTLSSYPCFYSRKSKSYPWTYDDRKADQGRRREVKKHMRSK